MQRKHAADLERMQGAMAGLEVEAEASHILVAQLQLQTEEGWRELLHATEEVARLRKLTKEREEEEEALGREVAVRTETVRTMAENNARLAQEVEAAVRLQEVAEEDKATLEGLIADKTAHSDSMQTQIPRLRAENASLAVGVEEALHVLAAGAEARGEVYSAELIGSGVDVDAREAVERGLLPSGPLYYCQHIQDEEDFVKDQALGRREGPEGWEEEGGGRLSAAMASRPVSLVA